MLMIPTACCGYCLLACHPNEVVRRFESAYSPPREASLGGEYALSHHFPFGQKVFTKRGVKSEYVLEKDLLESSVL
jgi:hypothetical protein